MRPPGTPPPPSAPADPDPDLPPLPPDAVERLTQEVGALVGNPVDAWAIVATLESIGWRDVDAQTEFGRPDLFALGTELYPHVKARAVALAEAAAAEADAVPDEPAHRGALRTAGRFGRYYGRGLLFAMPMVGQIAALLWLTYSMWAWLYFSEAEATVVALGTILSFVVTGGFIQAIGREGIHYLSNDIGTLARKSCYRLIAAGTATVIVTALVLYAGNTVFPFYPMRLMFISMMYFVLLAELWLFLSVLYVFEDLPAIFAVTLLGVIPVHLVMTYTTWSIYVAHWLGLAFALAVAVGYGAWRLGRRARRVQGPAAHARLPRPAVSVHGLAPYFAYGVLYFTFLFVDRVLAWSTPVDGPPPYVIWFRTPYELGMDWALLSLLLTLAALQYTIHTFSLNMIPEQKRHAGVAVDAHNRYFRRFYGRQMLLLVVIGLASIVVTYFAVMALRRYEAVQEVQDFFSSPVTYRVYFMAAFGYFFLAIGLLNGLFFFTLAQPGFVLRAILPAFLVNVAVGFLLSRWFGYEYAALGLVVGSAVFAGLSTRAALHLFRRFDYYYYAAY